MAKPESEPEPSGPHLVKPPGRQQLGDMLQRLARIAPNDLYAITLLTRDVLRHAEIRRRRYFQGEQD